MADHQPPDLGNYTIDEFSAEYLRICEQDPQDDEMHPHHQAAQFALTGKHPTENHHVSIQALTHQIGAIAPSMRRDYDSLSGFTTTMPVLNTEIMVILLPQNHHSLKDKLGIKIPFLCDGEVSNKIK